MNASGEAGFSGRAGVVMESRGLEGGGRRDCNKEVWQRNLLGLHDSGPSKQTQGQSKERGHVLHTLSNANTKELLVRHITNPHLTPPHPHPNSCSSLMAVPRC